MSRIVLCRHMMEAAVAYLSNGKDKLLKSCAGLPITIDQILDRRE